MITIEMLETLSDNQQKSLFQWRERVFPEEGRGKEWEQAHWHLVASEGAKALGHIGFNRFELIVAGQPIATLGVGGVVARPEYQGQGIIASLFERLHAEFQGELFSLFCPPYLVPYYRRYDYREQTGEVWFQQGSEQVRSQFAFMSRGELDPEAEIHISSKPW